MFKSTQYERFLVILKQKPQLATKNTNSEREPQTIKCVRERGRHLSSQNK